MQISLANYAEMIAAVTCTCCWLRKPSFFNRWFTPFLWLTIGIELTGKLMSNDRSTKMLLYNIFNWLEFVFYLLVFYYLATNRKHKKMLVVFLVGITIFCLVNICFGQGLGNYNSYSLVLGSFFLVIGCLREFSRLAGSDDEPAVKKWPSTCITTGILIFYSGNFAVGTFMAFLIKQYPKVFVMLYKIVNHNLNIMLYLLFSIGLIIELRKRSKELVLFDPVC